MAKKQTTKTQNFHLDALTDTGVSVKTQAVIELDGTLHTLGDPHRTAFVNSPQGRAALAAADLPENIVSAILAVWGETPTVADSTDC